MTETEKAIRDFCGHHADWWPSTTQVQEMLALAQPEITTGNILMDSYNAMQSMKVEGPRHVVCQCDKCKAQPEQEPVAWVCNGTNGHHDIDFFEEDVDSLSVGTQLYTTPPQRTWVQLTDEEAFKICVDCGCLSKDWWTLLDAIEAKLKEKNNG